MFLRLRAHIRLGGVFFRGWSFFLWYTYCYSNVGGFFRGVFSGFFFLGTHIVTRTLDFFFFLSFSRLVRWIRRLRVGYRFFVEIASRVENGVGPWFLPRIIGY